MAISNIFCTLILKKVEDKQLSQRLTPGSYQPDYFLYVSGGMASSLPIVGLFGRVGLVALGMGGALAGVYLSDNF